MEKFNLETIDPKKEVLRDIVKKTSLIIADPKTITKEELVLVSDTRKALMRQRTALKMALKKERDEANQYSKDVIAYEKELIAIIEPEEIRLKEIEDTVKEYNIREVRKEKLPEMRARIESIDDDLIIIDEELLEFDPNQFEEYYNSRVADKNEIEKEALEELKAAELKAVEESTRKAAEEMEKAQADLDAKKAEIDRVNKEAQDKLDEQAKKVENDRLQLERDKELEIAKKEAQIQAEKDAKEKADADARQKAEQEIVNAQLAEDKIIAEEKAKAADVKYQKWLGDNGYNNTSDFIRKEGNVSILYRPIAEYKHD